MISIRRPGSPTDASLERITNIGKRLLKENRLVENEATLYVEITRGAAPRTHYFPAATTAATMLVTASAFSPSESRFTGTTVITQPDIRWLRCDIKTVQLLPNVLARQVAIEAKASEAIFVRDGVITEGTHTTVFAMVDGELRTHHANHLVLPGVTRDLVIELAREAGIRVREAPVRIAELPNASELFLTGTTTDVTPVLRVDAQTIGNGAPGPVARALLERLLERLDLRVPVLASARS